ncbi:MAG: DUF4349 domain-containing protein [Lachnospiraceae bacterium]|nr:DUF4349 domain-containing protein [Lachnospiraceae bacterium]
MKKRLAITLMTMVFTVTLVGCGSSAYSSSDAVTMTADVYDETDMGYAEDAVVEEYADSSDTATDTRVSESAAEDVSESGSADDSYEQKLIRTVNMNVETTEFDAFIGAVEARAEELGGYVESSELSASSSAYATRWGSMTIRIPADSLDEFVSLVGENATVTYTSESTEDVTLTYVDLESHLTALRTEQETLLTMLEAAETIEDIIAIQSQLTDVRYEIESYESQLRVYDNKVNYSTVYLYIDEVERETAVADETFWGSVSTKFGENIYRVGRGIRNFAVNFLGGLPIILMVVVPVVVIVLIIRKLMNYKRKRRNQRFESRETKMNMEDSEE